MESYRVTEEHKAYLKTLRLKKVGERADIVDDADALAALLAAMLPELPEPKRK